MTQPNPGRPTAEDIVTAAGITPPPTIDVAAPQGINNLIQALDNGVLPDTYVRNGTLVQLVHVTATTNNSNQRAPLAVVDVTPDSLQRLLARHTRTIRYRATRHGTEEVPTMHAGPVVKAVLTETRWPGLRPLRGIVTAPVIRPDGTILQTEGYDPATWLYYAPATPIPPVPDIPDATDIARAREFVFNHVLADFPWADTASKANYVALLVTPLLRPYIGGLAPLGAISATSPGSGKTLLTDIAGALYGLSSRPWVDDDTELRKAITATLASSSDPVVVFDNVGEFHAVEQPTLAKLLTSEIWHDRTLGSSNQIGLPNDRSWFVTGNNLRFGGDIPSRAVLVLLDPRMPDPDQRTGFTIPDLAAWLEEDPNRATLLYHLLVLARAWITAGAPRIATPMRNFRGWASAMAGFTTFHGLTGFMTNRGELAVHDDEATTWRSFLATWHARHGDQRLTAAKLLADSRHQWGGSEPVDPWGGTFLTNRRGEPLTVRGLGMMLAAKRGRWFGEYSLHADMDRTNTRVFYVQRHPTGDLAQAQAVERGHQ